MNTARIRKPRKVVPERSVKAYKMLGYPRSMLNGTTLKAEVIRSIISKIYKLIAIVHEGYDFTTTEYGALYGVSDAWRGVEAFIGGHRGWMSCKGVNNPYLMGDAFVTDKDGVVLNPKVEIDENAPSSLLRSCMYEADSLKSNDYSDDGKVEFRRWKINGHDVCAIFEENRVYGRGMRQWMIDGNDRCPVICKYLKKPLLFDCSNGLCGEREFEEGSIIYEFFIKALGLPKEEFYNESTRDYFFSSYVVDEVLRKYKLGE